RPNPAIGGGALAQALSRVHGAYSLILMGENEVIAARDPFGFRPLVIGRLDEAIIFSSETCALDLVGAEFVREVEPGEVVVADEGGLRSFKPHAETPRESLCVFEFVYFARPDSQLAGRNVSHARTRMGRELARLHPVEADIVVPVPDSGTYAALGYSEQSGIPLDQAFVRNHYIGRTFLQPTQLIRDFNVRVKLNLIRSAVQGKRVVVVDDSIVRGTTARARVTNLREAGAREVHIRVSCPPHRFSCHYGIDFPNPKDLLANRMTRQEITKYLGADSLGYLDVDGMVRACGIPANKFCLACFTGDYPVPFAPEDNKEVLERQRDRSVSLVPEEESRQGFLL
ncbi:MAG: amidophosphoribosyltransferase, partial [Verrucomicrobia bacterium]|nr:amidophosphoribosyltransferase [Verrucomicrobiota bacterium]